MHMSGRAGAAGCFGAWLEDDMEGACADGFSCRVTHAAMFVRHDAGAKTKQTVSWISMQQFPSSLLLLSSTVLNGYR